MHKTFRFLFSKRFIALILGVLQVTLFIVLITRFYTVGPTIYLAMTIFSIAIMLYIFEKDNVNPSYKLIWVLVMVFLPITGAVFYYLWGDTKLGKKQKQKLENAYNDYKEHIVHNDELLKLLENKSLHIGKQARYLSGVANSPIYDNTSVKYYPLGENLFMDYMDDLRNAKKSIFIQYFIIDEGYMWDTILEVLKQKVSEGVDVRVIYDGFGSLITLPDNYIKTLRKLGIKAYEFNPLKFSTDIGDYIMLNHRDHRKMTIIDDNIGYSGGINIADEYINVTHNFGIWKDTGFRLLGEGVFGLTSVFLQTWQVVSKEKVDYSLHKPTVKSQTDGLIQPYYDTPLDRNNVCENAYLNVLNNATKYVYIASPYLIIDNEMVSALSLAAQSGVDVKIIVPGVPDKWYVYYITQSYYKVLLEAGVKIYEYTPGFIHAKMYLCDDIQAIVGSANMDYRSLYLHYENCCSFYGGKIVDSVKHDFEKTLAQSKEVLLEDVYNTPLIKKIYQTIFKVLSPLM